MPIPTHHVLGDLGHTNDHNNIVDDLTTFAAEISTLQGQVLNIFYTTGGNVVSLSGTSTGMATVNLPSGDRTSAVDTFAVFYASKKIFWLNGFGECRLTSSDPSRVPFIVMASSSAQIADLQQWQDSSGDVLARVDALGNLRAPNINPGPWTAIPLLSAYRANPTLGYAPSYRIVGDVVQIRGNLQTATGAPFSNLGTNPQIGSLPSNATPTQTSYFACGSEFSSQEVYFRLDIINDGTVKVLGAQGSSVFTPHWLSLDGVQYYRS